MGVVAANTYRRRRTDSIPAVPGLLINIFILLFSGTSANLPPHVPRNVAEDDIESHAADCRMLKQCVDHSCDAGIVVCQTGNFVVQQTRAENGHAPEVLVHSLHKFDIVILEVPRRHDQTQDWQDEKSDMWDQEYRHERFRMPVLLICQKIGRPLGEENSGEVDEPRTDPFPSGRCGGRRRGRRRAQEQGNEEEVGGEADGYDLADERKDPGMSDASAETYKS